MGGKSIGKNNQMIYTIFRIVISFSKKESDWDLGQEHASLPRYRLQLIS